MKLTFWKLLNDVKIIIPLIQRDYAQGREQDSEIREAFLSRIFRALDGEPLNMDFVYGRIENKTFYPLDGQQRLTTLFLLHWYFAFKEKKLSNSITEIFEKFSYETRISSEKFCKYLSKFNEVHSLSGGNDELSSIIINQSWFASSWKNDPTIKAMLIMLDAINNKFCERTKFSKISNGFELLIDNTNPIITFDFIELKDFNLDDDLYIKMNARGKILDGFELFKSELDKKLKKSFELSSIASSLITDFDGKYLDFFFEIDKSTKKINYGNYFLNFIIKCLSFFEFQHSKDAQAFPDGTSEIFKTSFQMNESKITIININSLIKILDLLKTSNDLNTLNGVFYEYFIDEKDLLSKTAEDNKFSYTPLLRFYAYIGFIDKFGRTNITALEQWMRIISNVTENTDYDKKEAFISALNIIINLLPQANNIENYFNSLSTYSQSYNWDEEWLKCKLLQLDSPNGYNWKSILISIERKDKFLKGQLEFLLRFSGLNKTNFSNLANSALEQDFYNNFDNYYKLTNTIFGQPYGLLYNKNFGNLFRRALLCCGDYFVNKGKYYTLLYNSDHRDFGFRRLFRHESKSVYLKTLYDKVIAFTTVFDKPNLTSALNNIINTNTLTGFRKSIAEHGILIDKMDNRFFLFYNNDYHCYDWWLPPCILTGGARTAPWYEFNSFVFSEELLKMPLCPNASVESVSPQAGDYNISNFKVLDTTKKEHIVKYTFYPAEKYEINSKVFSTKLEVIEELKLLKVLL